MKSANASMDFQRSQVQEKLQIGLVIRMGKDAAADMARITHIFDESIFAIFVSTPEMARYAKRPQELRRVHLEGKLNTGEWELGRLPLPPEFLIDMDACDHAYQAIRPLVEIFEAERALGRSLFTAYIQRRAEEIAFSVVSLRRLLLRFYYFGRMKSSLQPLKAGRSIEWDRFELGVNSASSKPFTVRRRGRQPIEANVLGRNDFSVSRDDISDMVECFEALIVSSGCKLIHSSD